MGLGLLLIPALGGYWFLTRFSMTCDRLLRASGYHLVMQSAVTGVFLFAAARVIVLGINCALPEAAGWWRSVLPIDYSGTSALALALGLLLPLALNPFVDRSAAQRRASEGEGNLIELVIKDALERDMFIEVSLRTGKSYVGTAMRSGLPASDQADVSLVPILSGYRDKDTAELYLIRTYAREIDEILSGPENLRHLAFSDFRVVVPMQEIVSVRLFDPEAYARLNAGHRGPPKEKPA